MIEELKILQGIVGDLSGLGAWLVAAYLTYKLMLLGAVFFSAHFLVKTVATHFKAGISKKDAEAVRADITQLKAEKDALEVIHQSEIDRLKAMYKILKEGADSES